MACVCAVLMTVAVASADVVVTTDGSRIVGKLNRFSSEGAVIETGFAGTLTIPAEKVASIATDEPMNVAATSGDVLLGKVAEQQGGPGMVVSSQIGDIPIAREKVSDVWPKGADSPQTAAQKAEYEKKLAAVTPKWTTKLEAGMSSTQGNNDTLDANGRLDIVRKTSKDRLNFFLWGQYAESENVRNKNNYGGGIRFDAFVTDRWAWYTRLRLEYDEFANLDLRATVAAGASYYWIKKDDHEFRTSLGLGYRHEEYSNGTTNKSSVLDAGFDYTVVMAPWATYNWSFAYSPSFERISDYRIFSDMGVTFPLKQDNLAFKLGLRHEYNSNPPPGTTELDTMYYANMVISIEN